MNRSLEEIKYSEEDLLIAKYAKAFAHPTRIAILNFVAKKKSFYTSDLVQEFPLAQSTISQHLKELKNAELIVGKLMPPRIKYAINKENWKNAQQLFGGFFKKI